MSLRNSSLMGLPVMYVFLKVSFNLKPLKIIFENFPSSLLAEPKTAFCSWINIGFLDI